MTPALSPRTYPLAAGTLAIGTSGYSIAGLLPAITTRLGTTPAIAGQLLTVFAITSAVSGPLIAVITRRWERRRLLITALMVTAVGNALTAMSTTVATLSTARAVTALGAAVYTANAAAMATHINRPEHRASALSVVFGGLTLALLLGVPGTAALSAQLSYYTVFWAVAALCVLAAIGIAVAEPAVSVENSATLRERLASASDRRVVAILAVTVLACTSTFAVYTYLTALLASTLGTHHGTISTLLAGYGVGAAIGNAVAGAATDRYGPRRTLMLAIGSCAGLLFVMPLMTGTVSAVAATLVAWGCAFWAINPPLSSWLVQIAPADTHLLLPLLGTAVYLGMGLGAILGGLVVTSIGIGMLGPVAATISLAACAVLMRGSHPASTVRPGEVSHLPQSALRERREFTDPTVVTPSQPRHIVARRSVAGVIATLAIPAVLRADTASVAQTDRGETASPSTSSIPSHRVDTTRWLGGRWK